MPCTKDNFAEQNGPSNAPRPSQRFGSMAGTPGACSTCARTQKCPVHAAVTRYQPTPEERKRRTREALAERIEKQTRLRVLDAIRRKLPAVIARPDLEMAAADYFLRLGHDNQRRLCRAYAWAEKKTKGAYGTAIVDYPSIAAAAIEAMSLADLHRFLVLCALVADLYTPSHATAQTLQKDTNLARTAARYKIDLGKVEATVRAELTNKKSAGTTMPKKKASASREDQRSGVKTTNQG